MSKYDPPSNPTELRAYKQGGVMLHPEQRAAWLVFETYDPETAEELETLGIFLDLPHAEEIVEMLRFYIDQKSSRPR